MFAINDLSDLERLERTGRVVAVFLADSFCRDEVEWISRVWDTLHQRSGMRWHMVVPSRRDLRGGRFADDDLDDQLAERLARIYGLSNKDFPCLVFDNFKDEERQLRVSIPGTDTERRDLMLAISEYLVDKHSGWETPRQELIDGLFNHLQGRRAFSKLVGWAPSIASAALRALTGVFTRPRS